MFHTLSEKVHRCVALGCAFNELGIPDDLLGVLTALFEDRERAGYQRGIHRAEMAVTALSNK